MKTHFAFHSTSASLIWGSFDHQVAAVIMATPGYVAPDLDREHPLFDKLVVTEGFVQPSSIVIRLLEGKINAGHVSMKVFRVEVR
jgi:hypothetical protein